jgi:hypothetical protein
VTVSSISTCTACHAVLTDCAVRELSAILWVRLDPGRAWSPGTSPCGRRDRHAPRLPGVPARDPGVEVRGTGRGRPASDGRPLVDDPGRYAQALGLHRGLVVLPVAARARPAAPVGHGGMEGRPRLGLALGRRGHPRAAPDALAGHRGPLPGRGGADRRRPGAAGPAHLARRSGTQPAMDPVPPGRGVRAAQRPCRPSLGVGGRAHWEAAAGWTAPLHEVRPGVTEPYLAMSWRDPMVAWTNDHLVEGRVQRQAARPHRPRVVGEGRSGDQRHHAALSRLGTRPRPVRAGRAGSSRPSSTPGRPAVWQNSLATPRRI